VTRLHSGTINEIYSIQVATSKYLLKIGHSNWKVSKTINEVSAMRFIRQQAPHVPVPTVVFWAADSTASPIKREYIFMEYLEVRLVVSRSIILIQRE
jgi:fructosamine-3-kinase